MRRTPPLALLVCAALAVALSCPAEAASADSASSPQTNRRLWRTTDTDGAIPFAVAVAPDGSRVYATGSAQHADFLTVAFHPTTGDVLWSSTYYLPGSAGGEALAIGVSPDGERVFVTGPNNEVGYVTVAYQASTGHQEWESVFTGFGDAAGVPYAIGVSPDNSRVFVTGTSHTDFGTIAYDAATGSELWRARYSGPAPAGADVAIDLGVSPDGARVFVTGSSPRDDDLDYATVAYDPSSGVEIWSVRYHDRRWPDDTPYALAVSPDAKRIFVTGCRSDLAECYRGDFMTIALNAADGNLLWKSIYDGAVLAPDTAYDVAVSPDNESVYVTGTSQQEQATVAVTISYDALTGTGRWIAQAGNASGPTFPWRVAVAGGRVVVTGSTGDYQGHRFLTIGYDASTGVSAWSVSGPEGLANGLGVSPDGSVAFVAGSPDVSVAWEVIALRTW
jgi:DNA-binding beta-propeller fold protein YncE